MIILTIRQGVKGIARKGGIYVKSIYVGKEAKIIKGKCAGLSGIVVGANSITKKISIELESGSMNNPNILRRREIMNTYNMGDPILETVVAL